MEGYYPASSTQNDVSDGGLLEKFISFGDQQAFADLVGRHAAWVYAAAARQLKDGHAADDATQAVFTLLFERADRVKSKKISGWLFITAHYVVRAMKRAQRRREHYERQTATKSAAPAATVEEIAGDLDAAVAALPDDFRTAIVLRFYRQLEFTEVAREMRSTEAAARKRVTRAVNRLRKHMGVDLSTSAIGSAALFGMPQSPPMLAMKIVSGLSSARLPQVISAMKGAMPLMTLAKLKLAVALSLAGLLIIVVAAIAGRPLALINFAPEIFPTATPMRAEHLPPKLNVSNPPAWQAAFYRVYGLGTGQVVRYIPRPFIPERAEFYRDSVEEGQYVRPPDAMTIQSINGVVLRRQWYSYGRGFNAADMSEFLLGDYAQDLDGNSALITKRFTGDFVFVAGASSENLRAGLENELGRALGQRIRLTYKPVTNTVFVLSGRWKGIKPVDAKQYPSEVEIYGRDLNTRRNRGGGAAGDAVLFAKWVGTWIKEPVVIEAEGVPKSFGWHENDEGDRSKESQALVHDPNLVLRHIEQQTGLTLKTETRQIRKLFIEPAGAATMP